MPQIRPVTAATMNYSAPILGGICGLSWIWYILYWVSQLYTVYWTSLIYKCSLHLSTGIIWGLLIDLPLLMAAFQPAIWTKKRIK